MYITDLLSIVNACIYDGACSVIMPNLQTGNNLDIEFLALDKCGRPVALDTRGLPLISRRNLLLENLMPLGVYFFGREKVEWDAAEEMREVEHAEAAEMCLVRRGSNDAMHCSLENTTAHER